MFGHHFFGAHYFGPRYWGDGGEGIPPEPPEPPVSPGTPVGVPIRPVYRRPEPEPRTFHVKLKISGGGEVRVKAHKDIEFPPDAEVMTFLSSF